jgi:hypothetical protein
VTTQIETFGPATSRIGQTILQSVLSHAHLDQLQGGRTDFNDDLRNIYGDGAVGTIGPTVNAIRSSAKAWYRASPTVRRARRALRRRRCRALRHGHDAVSIAGLWCQP